MGRAAALRDGGDGRQAARPRRHGEGRRAGRPGLASRLGPQRRHGASRGSAPPRLPAPHQGLGGRRREGHVARDEDRGSARRARGGPPDRGSGVRRRHGVPREAARGRPPRRVPDLRRRGGESRVASSSASAASSEDTRRSWRRLPARRWTSPCAGPWGRRRSPRRRRSAYVGAGTVEFLRRRKRRPLLLSGDEHPAAGRAPDHRGDAGLRSRAGPARGRRGRRAAGLVARWLAPAPRSCDRASAVRRGPGRIPAALGRASSCTGSPRARAFASTPASRKDRWSAWTTTRCSPSSIVSAATREAAIARAKRALEDWVVLGVETNARLLAAVLARRSTDPAATRRTWSRSFHPLDESRPEAPDAAWIAAALAPAAGRAGPARDSGTSARDPWSAYPSWRPGA